jgi:RHS repeat-associated protein
MHAAAQLEPRRATRVANEKHASGVFDSRTELCVRLIEEKARGPPQENRAARCSLASESTLFGKRYYAPLLGRWVSADPLTVHALGADLNLYAYVSGKALKAIDPLGLQSNEGGTGQPGHTKSDLNSQQHPKAAPTPAPGPETGSQGAGGGGPGEPNQSEPEANFTPGAGGAASQFYGGTRGASGQSHGGPAIPKASQTPTAGEIILMTPMGPEAAVAGVVRGTAAGVRVGSAAWKSAREAQLAQGLARLEQQTVGKLTAFAADTRGALKLGSSGAGADAVRFGQQGVSSTFRHGEFAGKTIDEVAAGLQSGAISADRVPLQVVVREGRTYTVNNRSLMALRKAGVEPTVIKDMTGNAFFEKQITERLSEMGGHPPEGFVPVVRGRR